MTHAIIYDCEFLTAPGAPTRFWNGPTDPDPVIAQIGAVKLSLTGDFAVTDRLRLHVLPRGRTGTRLAELSTGESTFFFRLSHERLGELTSDLLISYADTAEGSAAFLASTPAQLMDQVRRGAVAEVVGTEFIAAVSPPTALSLTWGLDDYVRILADAVGR